MSDIVAIHQAACPNFTERKIQLSCDGVHENKSTNVSIDVYSVSFKGCKNVYPHKLVRPLGKYKVDNKRILKDVIEDIIANDLRIMQFIADNPKRSNAKGCKCHSSWFPCEYCFAKGCKLEISDNSSAHKKILAQKNFIDEQIALCENDPDTSEATMEHLVSLKNELQKSLNALKRKTHILWPHTTMGCENRSRRAILDIVNKIESGQILTIDESKGIIERSILLDVPYFNFTYDAPAEYLHCGCLGVIKRLVSLTFDVGEKRSRVTKRKLTPCHVFNKLMLEIKVVYEFSRRARNLDFAVFKGQEFRNLALFFFPLVIQCIEENAKEIELWLLLAYMLRSGVIPSEEFSTQNIPLINQCCGNFYKLFQELFGAINCPYNLHVFCSHLMEMRTHGPLTETSAFKFESFYGELRRSFVPGTTSPMKQALKNIMLKRTLNHHVCQNSIYVSNYDTPKECNMLIYSFKRKQYHIYEVQEVDEQKIICQKLGKFPVFFPQTPNLNWSAVGVFRRGGKCAEKIEMNTSEICGKVLNVGKYLITCPNNVLREK